jgi:protein-L-isoaspartate O-methyltransferase
MILPLGGPDDPQVLVLLERNATGGFDRQDLWPVRFVPML